MKFIMLPVLWNDLSLGTRVSTSLFPWWRRRGGYDQPYYTLVAEVDKIISVQLLLQRSMSGREWMITCFLIFLIMAHGFLCSGEMVLFHYWGQNELWQNELWQNKKKKKKDGILQLEGKNMGWKDLDFGFKY